MREFPKPNVVISRCITFEPVRYNAQIISSEFVEKLKPFVNFVPVCPEVEIGLGVPRDPIRIVLVNGERRLMQPSTGLDFTEKMEQFANSYLNSLDEVDGFILKRGSPSSGFKNVKIYPRMEKSSPVGKGPSSSQICPRTGAKRSIRGWSAIGVSSSWRMPPARL